MHLAVSWGSGGAGKLGFWAEPGAEAAFAILARRYGIYVERSASAVLITTAISVITVALLVAHYAGVP